MSAFAKLFEVSGTQVVYLLGRDENGDPTVMTHTCAGGIFCSFGMSWDDSPQGWDAAEHHLASRTQTDALDVYQRAVALQGAGA